MKEIQKQQKADRKAIRLIEQSINDAYQSKRYLLVTISKNAESGIIAMQKKAYNSLAIVAILAICAWFKPSTRGIQVHKRDEVIFSKYKRSK